MKTKESYIRTILLKGILNFNGDSKFIGPIKRGFRPIAWLDDLRKGATSCSIISNEVIQIGESKEVEIVILNELQLGKRLVKDDKLIIGSTVSIIGDFIITENLGVWKLGKIP